MWEAVKLLPPSHLSAFISIHLKSTTPTDKSFSGTNYQSIPVNCPFATTVKNYSVRELRTIPSPLSLPILSPCLHHIILNPLTPLPLPLQRDGPMRVDDNQEGAPNYFPNSFGGPEPTPSGEKNEAGCYSYVTLPHAPSF